ncbi:MAG: HTTM domain-containing protein, partial [Candidatus Omnitrophica bacterium]|nr:HTTM domain-containing protein [Candidatus Omnitrophota bacterium]
MRVSVACILLYDLADRARFLKDHYTDWGLLPRRLAVDKLIQERMSLYFVSGESYFTVLLFLITAICIIALLIGYRTRLATALTWLLMFSLQNRGDWLNYSADVVVRLVLLWAIFLPWGAKFSLDSAFDDRPKQKPDTVLSVATIGVVVQFCLFYGMAGWLKTGEKWLDGSATYYALALDDFVRPLGLYAREHKEILVYLTKSVLAFEKIGWMLLIIPYKFAFFRMLGILGFLSMQSGFGNFLHVGIFPFISTAFLTCLLPTSFWIIAARKSVKKSPYSGTH